MPMRRAFRRTSGPELGGSGNERRGGDINERNSREPKIIKVASRWEGGEGEQRIGGGWTVSRRRLLLEV